MPTLTATFKNRGPFKGETSKPNTDSGILTSRGPRGGEVCFVRNVHSGAWTMVTGGLKPRSFDCVSVEVV
jgi:hypothetical protein